MAIVMSDVYGGPGAARRAGFGYTATDRSATALAAQYYPLFDPSSPTLVLNLQGADLARVQAVLLQAYRAPTR